MRPLWLAASLLAACATPGESADSMGVADADRDGTPDEEDCADGDPAVHPDQTDACDGIDNDCDGLVDEDATLAQWFRDQDFDGSGDPSQPVDACAQPDGYVADDQDCEPSRADAYPGAEEHCDGVDHDCDGTVNDDDAVDGLTWYADADGDGTGDPVTTAVGCVAPAGFVGNDDDCDDTRADVSPRAPEVCDDAGVDENCDGVANEDDDWFAGATAFWPDADGDLRGDIDGAITWSCVPPTGFVADYTDCDDTTTSASPDLPETCDGLDNDCDGEVDEDSATDAPPWYDDDDEDGYGDIADVVLACAAPEGTVSDSDDCDDHNDTIFPGAPDAPGDGVDADCDGTDGTGALR